MELTELIDTYRGPLIGLIASWGAPWADATEIAQDSFAEAYLSRQSCRGDWQQSEVFGPWLRGVARNCYRTWARNQRRRRERVLSVDPATLDDQAASLDCEESEQLVALRAAIERLSAKYREVVLMYYLEETRVKQIAVLLGTTEKTVEGRLYQARRKLRALLGTSHTSLDIGRMLLCL